MIHDSNTSHTLAGILSAQVRSWYIERQRHAADQPVLPLPSIVVSREYATSGAMVAQRVAEDLGFSYWDREIIHAIAERSGVPEALLATLDEHARSQVEAFISTLFGEDTAGFVYARDLSRVIATVARHGAALIVGHGAQLIVPAERTLRVRIIAPPEQRAREHMARHQVDLIEAERAVREKDREQRGFCRQYFGSDGTDPRDYDLVLNRERLGIEAAARTIEAAFMARFPEAASAITAGQTPRSAMIRSQASLSSPPAAVTSGAIGGS